MADGEAMKRFELWRGYEDCWDDDEEGSCCWYSDVAELEAENAKLSRLVDDITDLHERLECDAESAAEVLEAFAELLYTTTPEVWP